MKHEIKTDPTGSQAGGVPLLCRARCHSVHPKAECVGERGNVIGSLVSLCLYPQPAHDKQEQVFTEARLGEQQGDVCVCHVQRQTCHIVHGNSSREI